MLHVKNILIKYIYIILTWLLRSRQCWKITKVLKDSKQVTWPQTSLRRAQLFSDPSQWWLCASQPSSSGLL